MKFIALRDSFNGRYYTRGEVYEFETPPNRHFKPLEEAKPIEPEPEPVAFSQMIEKQAEELDYIDQAMRETGKNRHGKRSRNM